MDAERRAVRQTLGSQRQNVIDIVDGLADRIAHAPIVPSGWSVSGVVQHLGFVERYWFCDIAAGQECDYPWSDSDPDADWKVAPWASLDDVVDFYRAEVARADAAIDRLPWDGPPSRREETWDDDRVPDLRSICLHMIQETARHAGHLDIARELLDSKTGLGRR